MYIIFFQNGGPYKDHFITETPEDAYLLIKRNNIKDYSLYKMQCVSKTITANYMEHDL